MVIGDSKKFISCLITLKVQFFTKKLYYKHFTPAFWLQNNLCVFTTVEHKFKRWFCTLNFVLNIGFKDFWYIESYNDENSRNLDFFQKGNQIKVIMLATNLISNLKNLVVLLIIFFLLQDEESEEDQRKSSTVTPHKLIRGESNVLTTKAPEKDVTIQAYSSLTDAQQP